jgi:hypothetical protein
MKGSRLEGGSRSHDPLLRPPLTDYYKHENNPTFPVNFTFLSIVYHEDFNPLLASLSISALSEPTMAQVDASLTAVESHTAPHPAVEDGANSGGRPECFKSTLQEYLFVLTATMSIGMSSFLYGSTTVITAPIGRDLHMTSAQITWINASGA